MRHNWPSITQLVNGRAGQRPGQAEAWIQLPRSLLGGREDGAWWGDGKGGRRWGELAAAGAVTAGLGEREKAKRSVWTRRKANEGERQRQRKRMRRRKRRERERERKNYKGSMGVGLQRRGSHRAHSPPPNILNQFSESQSFSL